MNIKLKHEALLCNWIRDSQENLKIGNLACFHLGSSVFEGEIWKYNLCKRDSKRIFPGDSFWHKLLHMWHGYNYHQPQNSVMVKKQLLLCNSHIQLGGKPIPPHRSGMGTMATVGQLWENKHFINYEQAKAKYDLSITWYMYMSLIAAIPQYWKFCLSTQDLAGEMTTKEESIRGLSKISSWVYRDKNSDLSALRKTASIWNRKLAAAQPGDLPHFVKHFKTVKLFSGVTKLRDFQYRLLHNKIFCNDVLVHWHKVDSNICNLCGKHKQTIVHLMVECPEV